MLNDYEGTNTMSDITIFKPSAITVEIIDGNPPVDQSAEIAELTAQVAALQVALEAAQAKIAAAQAALA